MLVLGLLVPTFLAGIFMFLAPCTLPILPAYLGFISGASPEDIQNKKKVALHRIQKSALFFVFGFSTIFVLFGLLMGLAGSVVAPYKSVLLQIGGVFIILFGMSMTGLFSLPFISGNSYIAIPKSIKRGSKGGSFLIGSIFALGWSPCIGPILGTVLVLAGTSGTALTGMILLFVFSLGFAIPFLLTARLYTVFIDRVKKIERWLPVISFIGGIFLILIGVLLLVDKFYLFEEWGFRIFHFMNYQTIENFL